LLLMQRSIAADAALCRHPFVHRVEDPPLDVFDGLPGIALVPEPVEILCDPSKLDYEVAGEVFGLSLAALFPSGAEQGGLIVAHNDAGVGSADEGAPAS
jgi:hypothetical protein